MNNSLISDKNSAAEVLRELFLPVFGEAEATALSEKLLSAFGSLSRILKAAPELLTEQIGAEAAVYLRLCVSLFLRRTTDELKSGCKVDEQTVALHFDALFRDCGQETVYLLLLDERDRLTQRRKLSAGSLDTSGVSPRQILETAVRTGARSVCLLHNHPGADPTPSLSDEKITKAAALALKTAGIRFFGHFIFTDGAYFLLQMQDESLIKTFKEIR